MTPTSLLDLYRQRGIELEPLGSQIRCRAKKGVLTADIKHDISIHKAELLEMLAANRPIKRLSSPHGDIEINWDGQPLVGPLIGFDTETTMPAGKDDHAIQRLVLATVCDDQRRIVLPPEQIGDFLLAHGNKTLVFYNVAFDFWVVHEHLKRCGAKAAVDLLWQLASEGQLRDAMLLDQLLTIAVTGKTTKYLSLEDAAALYTDIKLDKEANKPYRENYADLLDVPLDCVNDRGWFDYAADDTLATLKVYKVQLQLAEALLQRHARLKTDFAAQVRRWGYLTENVQVLAAIALDKPYRAGLRVDPVRQQEIRKQMLQDIALDAEEINELLATEPYKQYMDDKPLYKTNKSGKVSRSTKKLNVILEKVVLPQLQGQLDEPPRIPRTEKTGALSTSRKHWEEYAAFSPVIDRWLRIDERSKMLQFVQDTDPMLHPRYQVLVSSGRTSCQSPNIQQLPRDGGIRAMILPPVGHVFLTSDYETLELRTLAQISLDKFGESRLADVFEQDIDPHAYTASLLLGLSYEQFMAIKKTDEKLFKAERQKAKAINFGTPGGMGVQALINYAKHTYGVKFTVEEARDLRQRLITEIYPEIGWYLEDDGMEALAWNFNTTADNLWNVLNWDKTGARPNYVPGFYRRILRGETCNANGEAYSKSVLDNAWMRLQQATVKNPDLHLTMHAGQGSQELLRASTGFPAITTTGRIRGQCEFTQVRNVPFQGLAADGAKLAVFELVRRGWDVAIFVHDEVVVCVPEGSDYETLGSELVDVMVTSMKRVVPDVPIKASEAVPMRCWSKEATRVKDASGRLIPWSPLPEK